LTPISAGLINLAVVSPIPNKPPLPALPRPVIKPAVLLRDQIIAANIKIDGAIAKRLDLKGKCEELIFFILIESN